MTEVISLVQSFGVAFYFLSVTSALGIVLSVYNVVRYFKED